MSSLVNELIEAGIHFGQRRSNWNPKMGPFIHGTKNQIHIIDIKETIKGILLAKKFIAKCVSENKDVVFVGTKRQARAAVETHCGASGMPYVTERWLGGTLTNFRTVRERLKRLEELERLRTECEALRSVGAGSFKDEASRKRGREDAAPAKDDFWAGFEVPS